MTIQDGLGAVDIIVRQHISNPTLYGPFAVAVMKRAAQSGLLFEEQGCHARYDKDCHEIHMWGFGLMICEYVAGLLEQKAKEGHCTVHRQPPDWRPCPTMQEKHLEMLEGFKDALTVLVQEINTQITDHQSGCGDTNKA